MKRITFDWLNRRTHLYMGLALLPWFFVYGASSVPFSHPKWFEARTPKLRFERPYHLDPVLPDADLRPIGEKIQRDLGLEGHYTAFRGPRGEMRMYHATFLSVSDVIYDSAAQRIRVEDQPFRWAGVLTRLHTRGGFEQPGFLVYFWSVVVDLVQVAIILWICTGLVMWWNLRGLRKWGWLALGAGSALFAFFMLGL